MKWKLYLDDLRTPVDTTFVIARTVEDAQELIRTCGIPIFISFDHDLGIADDGSLLPTGYDFVKWLVEMDMEGKLAFPESFGFKVHSQNPVGAKNIQEYLINYITFRNQHNQEISK